MVSGHSWLVLHEGVEAMILTSINLGSEARAILEAARHADNPSTVQRWRVGQLLALRLDIGWPAPPPCGARCRLS